MKNRKSILVVKELLNQISDKSLSRFTAEKIMGWSVLRDIRLFHIQQYWARGGYRALRQKDWKPYSNLNDIRFIEAVASFNPETWEHYDRLLNEYVEIMCEGEETRAFTANLAPRIKLDLLIEAFYLSGKITLNSLLDYMD